MIGGEKLYLRYKAIAVYKRVAEQLSPLAELLRATDAERAVSLCALVFSRVVERGCSSVGGWIKSLVLADENAFSRAAARGERIPDILKCTVNAELVTLKQLSLVVIEDIIPPAAAEVAPRVPCGGFSCSLATLTAFYATNGCGTLAEGSMFVYKDGAYSPSSADVRLDDLKNYAEEKAEIVRNTENFIKGLPAFHTLLYGDRGTGKTATVRAIAREYADKLKVIEIAGSELTGLARIKSELAAFKQKYILFIDDPSLDGESKSALEGALESSDGVLVYCTCDRRRAFGESADDGRDELAVFDRFGLVVTYLNPEKNGFVDILRQILRSRGIKWRDEYTQIAELVAIKNGGRSPRAAKQIADLIESTYAQKRSE